MMKIYVDEEVNVFYDDKAEQLLSQNSDLSFFDSASKGVHKVPEERWKTAQKYERKTWMETPNAGNDRNNEHLERFENLSSLANLNVTDKNVIELGCGPFTNLRLMSDTLKPAEITLLDPLISDYINHPNCAYKESKMHGINATLIPSSIENFNVEKKFDIVIMINVLEHCYDIDLIFEKVNNMLSEKGIFIFSDVYFDDVQKVVANYYDAGHPIRVSTEKVNTFLQNFNTIFEKRYHGLYSQEWRNDLYFIGEKIN